MSKMIRIQTILALVASFALAPVFAVEEGEAAPDFTLPALQEGKAAFSLSAMQGKAVFVDFWASWCAPCLMSLPLYNEMYHKYKDQGLEAWAILIYDQNGEPPTNEYCKSYKEAYGLEMRVLYDPNLATAIYGGKETSIINNEAGQIVHEAHSDLPTILRQAIEDELEAGYGECSAPAVCGEEFCAPTPTGDSKVCAPLCTYGDDSTCPEGETCWRYDETKDAGFCFAPDLLP